MDLPQKPKSPPAKRARKRSAQEERQDAALAKIAKNYRRVRVAERRSGPQFLAVLLSLLGAALVLYKIFGPGLWKSDGVGVADVAPAEAAAGALTGPIDPGPYRETIEGFEKPLLGQAPSPDLGDLTETILRTGNKLTASLQLDTRFSASRRVAQSLQASLDALAARKPPQLGDFEKLRQDWLVLRQREFSPAPFYLAGGDPQPGDHFALTAYRTLLNGFDQALNAGFDRAAAYAREPEQGETAEEKERRLAGLDQVAHELAQSLAGLRRTLPERPAGNLDPNLMLAVQSLEQALAEAEGLAGSAANLTPAGQKAFDNVQLLIDRTRGALDQLAR